MKRLDPITNTKIEVLFTEAAYEIFRTQRSRFSTEVSVRMKSNYHIAIENTTWDKVYLMRLIDEQNSSNLQYHSEYWYTLRDYLNREHQRQLISLSDKENNHE